MTQTGIYIHIPFCRSRCSYCDFATGAFDETRAAAYVAALIKEIDEFPKHQPFIENINREVETIYFGGGTPSLLSVKQVEILLEVVHRNFHVAANSEITLEINPATVDKSKARDLKSLGINRASFGAQTFNDAHLKQLGRAHDAAAITETFEILRCAGFSNINFDLIAALPNQTLADWQNNLTRALELKPEHLSLYLLELLAATPLAAQIEKGRFTLPDEDATAEMYRALIAATTCHGYQHYEISNFCLPGFQARHNSKYWTRAAVYGFGCSAHSFDGAAYRWANERDINSYISNIERGASPLIETTLLTLDDARAENIFLGLRLLERGISLLEHKTVFAQDLITEQQAEIERLTEAGLISIDGERLKLTSAGALMSNEVFATLA